MKFTTFSADVSNVSKLPDIPTLEDGYTPEILKKTFDRAGEDVKNYINAVLLPELEEAGADRIGSAYIESLEGESVQKKLESIALKISALAGGSIPEGSITPEKFIPSVASFMTEGSPHAAMWNTAGEYTFIPTRSGNHKISVQGAGGGGSVGANILQSVGGGSGAYAEAWYRLEAGREYKILVGAGGEGLTVNENQKLLADAVEGGGSAFYDGDVEVVWADGGKTKLQSDGPAVARGGLVMKNGEYPMPFSFNDYDILCFERGAPSHLSPSTHSSTSVAGAGAGGYGASFSSALAAYKPGGKGGDGCVIIEWME